MMKRDNEQNEDPQIFSIKRDVSGKARFSRRQFIAASGAAVAAGILASCGI